MTTNNNPPASGGQKPRTAGHLAAMLSRGEAPSLDALLGLCPDEPLLAAEPYEFANPGRTANRGNR